MRSLTIILCSLSILSVCAQAPQVPSPALAQAAAASRRIVIAASAVLDGQGRVLRDTRIVIEGSKIVALYARDDPKAGPADYDLRGLTVMPSWIDAHVHITWSFGKGRQKCERGRNHPGGRVSVGRECLGNVDGGLHHCAGPGLGYRCSPARCH